MASKYQFQLFNAAANNTPFGQPIPMDAPYNFNAGDLYVFGPNQASAIAKVSHSVTFDGAGNITFTTCLLLNPPGASFELAIANGGDLVVPWPKH